MTKQLTKQTIGVGVAGTGFIGPAHIEGLRRNGIQVLGLAENSREKAEQKAAELGHSRASTARSMNMLADPDIDVVHLATPNHLHYPHAKAALLAGKHVVCEKPLAMNSARIGRTGQAGCGKEAGQRDQFQHPHVSAGPAGAQHGAGRRDRRSVHPAGILPAGLAALPTDWNWRLEPQLGGTLRAVGDIGSHWLDLMTFITGLHVEEVYADFKTFHPIRKKPAKPLETFTGKMLTPEDYIDQPISHRRLCHHHAAL